VEISGKKIQDRTGGMGTLVMFCKSPRQGLVELAACECEQQQTVNHPVDMYPLTKS